MTQQQRRRGNYTILFAPAIPVILGFCALSVDISLLGLAKLQAQDATDAAGHAAFIAYKQTGSTGVGTSVARHMLNINPVADGHITPNKIHWGRWDIDRNGRGTFRKGGSNMNAVKIKASRRNRNAITPIFGQILGHRSYEVNADSVTSEEPTEVMLVQDFSGSFYDDLPQAMDANLTFLDVFHDLGTKEDQLGFVGFKGAANVTTPLTLIHDSGNRTRLETDWRAIKANTDYDAQRNYWQHRRDNVCWTWQRVRVWWWWQWRYVKQQPCWDEAHYFASNPGDAVTRYFLKDMLKWSQPSHTWEYWYKSRYYRFGSYSSDYLRRICTNQGAGIESAKDEFTRNGHPYGTYKAMVVLSDGLPVDCYRYQNNSLRNFAISEANNAWTREGIHIWSVAYLNGGGSLSMLRSLVKGDGTAYETPNPTELERIMEDIARRLNLRIVR